MTFVPPQREFRIYSGYCSSFTLSEATAGTGNVYGYRLNSLYDPDFSSTGTSAMGYSAYSSLYSLFRVTRVRAVIRATSTTTGVTTVGFVPGVNSTVTNNFLWLIGQPYSQSADLSGNVGGEHSSKEWNTVIDLPLVAGVTRQQYLTDMDFAHGTGSNPARSLYLWCFIHGYSGSIQTVAFTVRLIFDVLVSSPLDIITG